MAGKQEARKDLSSEERMMEHYEMMLKLGMVEMVTDLDLTGRRARKAEAKGQKKEEAKK